MLFPQVHATHSASPLILLQGTTIEALFLRLNKPLLVVHFIKLSDIPVSEKQETPPCLCKLKRS